MIPTRMPLEILAPGDRPRRRRTRDRPRRPAVDAVDQMNEQRERRHQRAILRDVREQHRMVLLRTKGLLEISPPRVEEFLGLGLEAQERHLVRREVRGADPRSAPGCSGAGRPRSRAPEPPRSASGPRSATAPRRRATRPAGSAGAGHHPRGRQTPRADSPRAGPVGCRPAPTRRRPECAACHARSEPPPSLSLAPAVPPARWPPLVYRLSRAA